MPSRCSTAHSLLVAQAYDSRSQHPRTAPEARNSVPSQRVIILASRHEKREPEGALPRQITTAVEATRAMIRALQGQGLQACPSSWQEWLTISRANYKGVMTAACVPDADVAGELAVRALLDADIHQSILPKNTLSVQVGCKEAAFAVQGAGRGQALHVGRAHDVLQECIDIVDGRIHSHLQAEMELLRKLRSTHVQSSCHGAARYVKMSVASMHTLLSEL